MAKDKTQKTEVMESGIKRIEGRVGSDTHYVEFDPNTASRVKFIAQKGAGGNWFIFKSYPGKKGAVKTLGQSTSAFSAIKYAEWLANGNPELKDLQIA